VQDDGTVGVYVHVPFCERICPYCDFAVVRARTLSPEREGAYVDALLGELERRRARFAERGLASLYLGGGTPSLLQPGSVERIGRAVRAAFRPLPGLEVTLEVNPSTLERGRLPGFRTAGVNRLSLGIQSFDDRVLKRLGRAHRAEEGRTTLAAARAAGFDNVSIDLLFGAPGQGLADLERDLAAALESEPEHVSAYQLTIEAGTPFERAARRGQLALPDDETGALMYERLAAALEGAGLYRYEISSWARPGFASRHNRRYWERRPVLGLGVGAWSAEPPDPAAPYGARSANPRSLEAYLARSSGPQGPTEPRELLDATAARGEAVFLALRTAGGLAARTFEREFGAPPRHFFAPAIQRLTEAGLLAEAAGGDLRLTPRGILLSDSVFEHFV
jgi:putative oxygen-independent coproporphyrinogen III oxidase